MRVLVTGITGFAGSHLADYLLAERHDVEVHGTRRWRSKSENITHLEGRVVFHECDFKDAHNVYELVERLKPDRIFHLAAQSYVPASWDSPAETLETNVVGQCNLLEAIRKFRVSGYDPVVQIAGSSEEYGAVEPNEMPIKEETPLRPLSPYAVSKVAQDLMAYQYFKSFGIRTIRTRAFNHSGPRRGEVFVDSNFAKQIAEIEKGLRPPKLLVGNLDAIRDFSDVRDIVEAYWLATEHGVAGEVYNIASGRGYRIRDVLDALLKLAKRKDIAIEEDAKRMRPSDVPVLFGDSTKFRQLTSWSPKFSYLDHTLRDMLEYWRERV